jgi:MerR family transcriptional regulator, light-induced transcriptional regulator
MPMTYEERSMMLLGAAGCPSAEASQTGQTSRPAARGGRRGKAVTRQSRRDALIRTIEGQIVPRLLLARASVPASEAPLALPLPGGAQDPQTVAELTRLLLEHTSEVASVYVQLLHADGASIEAILLNVLAPAARRLGALWESDDVDFFAVSLGLARLQTIVRELSAASPQEDSPPGLAGTILLVPEIGEQHTFGLQLVAEFFRRARWDVWLEQPASTDEYARLIAAEHFAVIGLAVGSDSKLEHLAGRITATRRGSRNRSVCVMVGGPLFLNRPEIARQVGADATATDGPQAVQIAQTLVKSLAAAGVATP